MHLDQMARELFFAIGAFQAGPIRRVEELSQGEMAMLGYLILGGGEVNPTQMSRHLDLSTARVANALNSMEKKGYIRRTHDLVDRRRVLVTITDMGREKAQESMDQAMEGLKELLVELGEEDARTFVQVMGKVAAIIRRNADAAPGP